MIQVALYQPEIPPNTGNIIRLCANLGAPLHLIHPLGFAFDDRRLRRAGLDYHDLAGVTHHSDVAAFLRATEGSRLLALTTRARCHYCDFDFNAQDILLFGAETRGLPQQLHDESTGLRIPMRAHSRSINLANCVAIVAYEAWRQLGFAGGA